LGLTIACARCHDHKYDPIPTRDYYALAAAYNGSTLQAVPLANKETVDRRKTWEKKAKETETKLNQWIKEQAQDTIKSAVAEAGRYLQAAWQIRVLKQYKLASDIAETAARDNLHPLFLERAVRFLEQGKFEQQDPVTKSWLAVMSKASPAVRPASAQVEIPDELSKATLDLNDALRVAVARTEKNPANLLNTLSLGPGAVSFVRD